MTILVDRMTKNGIAAVNRLRVKCCASSPAKLVDQSRNADTPKRVFAAWLYVLQAIRRGELARESLDGALKETSEHARKCGHERWLDP